MDEVDGMSAGDRGGAAGIAELIAKSRSPVICICNDAHDKKLTPLKRVSMCLTFQRYVPRLGNLQVIRGHTSMIKCGPAACFLGLVLRLLPSESVLLRQHKV